MTTRTVKRAASAAALSLTGMLALAGCSGSDDSGAADTGSGDDSDKATQAAATYQFDEARVTDQYKADPYMTSESPITIALSDELKATVPDGKKIAIDHYTITPKAFDTGLCRLDVDIAYADGGQQSITEALPRDDDADADHTFFTKIAPGALDGAESVEALPSNNEISDTGAWFTRDHTKLTIVDDCSSDVNDSAESLIDLRFPYTNPGKTNNADDIRFADADIFVASGSQSGAESTTTFIRGETVTEIAANGEWMTPTD